MKRDLEPTIPEDILQIIARLERKRLWRESWEQQIDDADAALDRAKEEGTR